MASSDATSASLLPSARDYQHEMLQHSLRQNIIVAMDTGSGKTLIAVLRIRAFLEQNSSKVAWFLAPTVMLCEQQKDVLTGFIATPVALVSGALEPNSWKDPALWQDVLKHRVIVSTPQVLLDALHHGYVSMGAHIGLIIFDEAHHVADKHPYNLIMKNFYFGLPPRSPNSGEASVLERPAILGLTASPTFGGNDVEEAFQTIEDNLDSVILAPSANREEYAQHTHRPVFKHLMYTTPFFASTRQFPARNLVALAAVVNSINIENDPYVQSLRQRLATFQPASAEWTRIDQRLSKTITREDSYTHKGLRDFLRAAEDICCDLGPWCADWFIEKIIHRAQASTGSYHSVIEVWNKKEKHYLLSILSRVHVVPVSYEDKDVVSGVTDKVEALIECLLKEKALADADNEVYSCLVFVQRRDSVLALSELLRRHPASRSLFHVGCLLGSSNSQYRRAFLDITRELLGQSQADTLRDFRIGEKTLIISTAVAEEGIDIQACGTVVRWDIPENMVSWAQSRGRARRKKSTFVLMFDNSGEDEERILKWQKLEREMEAQFLMQRHSLRQQRPQATDPMQTDENDEQFRVNSTGALLTPHSAVAHLEHFCAVIPNGKHVPVYDDDPPEFPEGWHLLEHRNGLEPYEGPFGATVTLPRLLPLHLRFFGVGRDYATKVSARQHVAYKAYLALYKAELLNDHLLPLTSVLEPNMEGEVKTLLEDVMKRAGTADVALQMNPWAPPETADERWYCSELTIDDMPTLHLLTQVQMRAEDTFELYTGDHVPRRARVVPLDGACPDASTLAMARDFTRTMFWSAHGNRMSWDDTDFKYLLLPATIPSETTWGNRRAWWRQRSEEEGRFKPEIALLAPADLFVAAFGLPADIGFVADGKPMPTHSFISWRRERLDSEEEQELEARHARFDLRVTYPLIHARALPRRANFLVPSAVTAQPPETYLLLQRASLVLSPPYEVQYALLLPSIFRSMAMTMTLHSFRTTVLAGTSLMAVQPSLLLEALTAPVSQEKDNYQRLETLGDTALKVIASVSLFAAHPFWHEGYLSRRKDHVVSNAQLALRAIDMGIYKWIIRDRFVAKKWKPAMQNEKTAADIANPTVTPGPPPRGTTKRTQQLSTKLLADVMEACIGAAMLTGSWELAVDCVRLFGLGLADWPSLATSVQTILERTEELQDFPTQTTDVERIIGYTFKRKAYLVEAITHSSSQGPFKTTSYERMEFLGDAVLDWIITERLYKAEGKNYSPGHMHLRKSAIVNGHFLAFICLRSFVIAETSLPHLDEDGNISLMRQDEKVHLFQCMLHSSHIVLQDQENSFARYNKLQQNTEEALAEAQAFPWELLVRLQAPKFLSDMLESLLGAVWLDSEGSFEVVRDLLARLGILEVLDRIISDDVDVQHPVSRLALWASRRSKKIEYHYEKTAGAKVTCSVLVRTFDKEGKVEVAEPTIEARVSTRFTGRRAEIEARFAAAELATKRLQVQTMDEMLAEEPDVDLDLDSDDEDDDDQEHNGASDMA